jgi:hypothetical protein
MYIICPSKHNKKARNLTYNVYLLIASVGRLVAYKYPAQLSAEKNIWTSEEIKEACL